MKKIKPTISRTPNKYYLIVDTTANDQAAVGLIKGAVVVKRVKIRRGTNGRLILLKGIVSLWSSVAASSAKLAGIFVVNGSGSSTALRTSIITAESISLVKNIPLAGVPASIWEAPNRWLGHLQSRRGIKAEYGFAPSITMTVK